MTEISQAIKSYQQGMGRISTRPGNIVSPKPCADNGFRQYGNPYQQYQQNDGKYGFSPRIDPNAV